jgi:hypothetical protein
VTAGTLRFESVTDVTALGGVALGVVPGVPMPRVDLEVSRANLVTLPGGDSYLTGMVWGARLTLLGDVTYRGRGTTAVVGGVSVGLSACYAPLFDAGALELRVCTELAAGVTEVRTQDDGSTQTHSKRVGLGTSGLGTELAYNIGRHFHVGMKLGADVSIAPITAERANGARIFESSWLSGHGMLGLGGQW